MGLWYLWMRCAMINMKLIKLIGKIGNELMEERENVGEKIIVQQTISRLVKRIENEKLEGKNEIRMFY